MGRISFIINKFSKKLIGFRSNESRIKYLGKLGLKIGEGCLYFSNKIPPEPYLVKIGNHVVISSETEFITHDGSVWVFREKNPKLDVFGMTTVGNNTFIGIGCILLPNTKIGNNCIIGAGSVVRGIIPDNSVVMGNPAKIIMSTELMEKLTLNNKNALQTKHLSMAEKAVILKKHFNIH
jgi:acetyltransferase-like isoleucine patch superfamily enzyme